MKDSVNALVTKFANSVRDLKAKVGTTGLVAIALGALLVLCVLS